MRRTAEGCAADAFECAGGGDGELGRGAFSERVGVVVGAAAERAADGGVGDGIKR